MLNYKKVLQKRREFASLYKLLALALKKEQNGNL